MRFLALLFNVSGMLRKNQALKTDGMNSFIHSIIMLNDSLNTIIIGVDDIRWNQQEYNSPNDVIIVMGDSNGGFQNQSRTKPKLIPKLTETLKLR